jgi:ADP-heptose:LPS heptosyltransferase
MNKMKPRVIAIVNLAAFGDTVAISPLSKAVRNKFPESKIIYIASPMSFEAAKCSIVEADEIIIYDKRHMHKGISGIIKFLKSFKYWGKVDIAIVQSEKRACALVAFLMGSKIRIGWNSNKRGFLLTNPLKKTPEILNLKIVDYDLKLLEPLEIINSSTETKFIFSHEDKLYIDNILAKLNPKNHDLIGLCPCSSSPSKDWKPKEAATFINFINETTNKKVVILGTKIASEFCLEIRNLGTTDFIDMTDKTSISQVGALVSKFKTLVTVDTGPMHVAFALKIPTINLIFKDYSALWIPDNTNNKVILDYNHINAQEVIKCYKELSEEMKKRYPCV